MLQSLKTMCHLCGRTRSTSSASMIASKTSPDFLVINRLVLPSGLCVNLFGTRGRYAPRVNRGGVGAIEIFNNGLNLRDTRPVDSRPIKEGLHYRRPFIKVCWFRSRTPDTTLHL